MHFAMTTPLACIAGTSVTSYWTHCHVRCLQFERITWLVAAVSLFFAIREVWASQVMEKRRLRLALALFLALVAIHMLSIWGWPTALLMEQEAACPGARAVATCPRHRKPIRS